MPIELPQQENCPFCRFVNSETDVFCLDEMEDTFAFLNPRQFGKGHVIVIPKRHAATVLELEATEAMGITQHVHRLATALARAFDPAGLNIFQNNGVTAGQTVAHYHVHIVPSYAGDQPGRIFNSQDFERTSHEYRSELAKEIRMHLV